MVDLESKPEPPAVGHGPVRRMLRLIVEADSSRFVGTRVTAGLLILAALALFGFAGYGLAALVSRWFF